MSPHRHHPDSVFSRSRGPLGLLCLLSAALILCLPAAARAEQAARQDKVLIPLRVAVGVGLMQLAQEYCKRPGDWKAIARLHRLSPPYVIRADREKYAFFSIPNDMGWSAVVNGEPAEILDICGFMAVRIGEGENRIGFHYSVPGLTAGIALTAAGFMISLLYIIFTKHRRKGAHKS